MGIIYQLPEMKIRLSPRGDGYPELERAMEKNEPIDILGVKWFVLSFNTGYESAYGIPDAGRGYIDVILREAAPLEVATPRPETDQSKREGGFYWVKNGLDWIVAEWLSDRWVLTGSELDEPDGYFQKIGPRLVPPEER